MDKMDKHQNTANGLLPAVVELLALDVVRFVAAALVWLALWIVVVERLP